MPPLNVASMRTKPPSLMQVSVPGIKKKPAPYSEQTLTYSTALALTGRSAACAPPTASKPAAEPRIRRLIVVMFKPPSCLLGGGRTAVPPEGPTPSLLEKPLSRFAPSHTPHERERLERATCNGTIENPPPSLTTMHALLR